MSRHRWLNRLQTLVLVLTLLAIAALLGSLLFGQQGLWLALAAAAMALLIEPAMTSPLTLRLYRARPLHPEEAPQLWHVLHELAQRAGLRAVPEPYYIPSTVINAFATGSTHRAAIALTDGLLRNLTPRELAGVLGHEIAHIANEDLRVMGLADSISRLTQMMSLFGQVALLFSVPAMLAGLVDVSWAALLVLLLAPQLALLVQMGLSRVREFDADRLAAELTGDPLGLASALARIERANRNWRAWLLPGWGNPEPSWLRTHPATADRIRRLQVLAESMTPRPLHAASLISGLAPVARPPRWHASGLWR